MSESRRNVELKARDTDTRGSLEVCESLGAEARGVLVQRDTYSHVARGRLKLREGLGPARLISYDRSDRAERE